MRLETPDQRAAMKHPMRHRILLCLKEPATVSELARTLRTNKGNAAHHVAVLERVGLLERVGTRTGRGGTGVLYGVPDSCLRFEDPEATAGMLGVIAEGLRSDPAALSLLRTIRLTPQSALALATYLERLVLEHPAEDGAPRHGIHVAVLRA